MVSLMDVFLGLIIKQQPCDVNDKVSQLDVSKESFMNNC